MKYSEKVHQIVLLKKEANGYTPFVNGVLLDNGDKENTADLIEGDRIYSAKVDITPANTDDITLVAAIQKGDSWQEVSKPVTLHVYEPLSVEQAQQVASQSGQLQTKIQQLQNEGKTTEEVQALVIEQLEEAEEIATVGTSETSGKVWYALKSGALGAVSVEGTLPTVAAKKALASNTFAANQVVTTSVGNKKVAIFSAHGQTAGEALANTLKENDFTVDYFKDELASVESFKKMFEYGTIIFDTQGAALFKGDFKNISPSLSDLYNNETEQVVFYTGEAISVESLQKYSADLKTGRLVIMDGYYAITPAFVQYYSQANDFADSLVYANSPFSFNNDTMANQFLNNKAQAYVGFEGDLQNSALSSFNAMLQGEQLQDALSNEKLAGNGKLSYAKSALLANGDLEDGKNYWISGGHFDTITKLGLDENYNWTTINPTKGNSMGIISSGVDDKALNGRQSWVYQTFYVPEDMNVLKFDYNVVSNEPMEFLGSGYDDTFKATIVEGIVKEPKEVTDYEMEYGEESIYDVSWLSSTVDVDERIIAYESVNSSDWGQDYAENAKRVDVIFGDGDHTTYMTGWETLTYDVSQYKGKSITLKLQTWDLGDTAYPTAVLFDNVRLTNSTLKEITIDGVSETFIPKYGKIERQFNAVYVDQYGDKVTGDISLRLDDFGYRQPVIEQQGTFRLKEEVKGVSIDAQTGILTITDAASPGEITVVATGGKNEVEHKVVLKQFDNMSDKIYLLDEMNFIIEQINYKQPLDEYYKDQYSYELASLMHYYGYLFGLDISEFSYEEIGAFGELMLNNVPSQGFESFEQLNAVMQKVINEFVA